MDKIKNTIILIHGLINTYADISKFVMNPIFAVIVFNVLFRTDLAVAVYHRLYKTSNIKEQNNIIERIDNKIEKRKINVSEDDKIKLLNLLKIVKKGISLTIDLKSESGKIYNTVLEEIEYRINNINKFSSKSKSKSK